MCAHCSDITIDVFLRSQVVGKIAKPKRLWDNIMFAVMAVLGCWWLMVMVAAVTVKMKLIVTYKHFLSDTGKDMAVSVTLGQKDAA